jgi:SAM-dependent methyltransferase
MRDQDLEHTYRLEENFWWFRGMRNITWSWISDLRPESVLDAGCGTGFHLKWLKESLRPSRIVGIDIAGTALRYAKKRESGFSLAQASVADLPFASEAFDFLTCFDVLSQLPPAASGGAVSEFRRVLKRQGHLFVRAPAMAWLRSSHDAELQTWVRFTIGQLSGLLQDSGFEVIRSSYANFLLFPVAVVRRLLKHLGLSGGSDVRPMPEILQPLDPVFLAALNAEARWLQGKTSFPFGLSAIMLARKI